jgi:hypothetical protein
MAVAKVGAVFAGGDGGIGLGDDVVKTGTGPFHAGISEFDGVALAKVEIHGDGLGIPVELIGTEKAEEAVRGDRSVGPVRKA